MKYINVPEYIIKEAQDALRIAANILGSRKRETSADRSIEYSERLLNWVLAGQIGEPPSVIPKKNQMANKIPTAKRFCMEYPSEAKYYIKGIDDSLLHEMFIEFAKLHVQKALEAAAKNATTIAWGAEVDKDSILNAYNLNLIK